MRSSLWTAALLLGLSAAWAGEPARNGGPPDKAGVDQLVKKLGSDKFADRERASAALEKLGADAYEALKKVAAAKDTDQETRSRAEKILAKISQKVESAALLAPTKVHLVLKDTPVPEAVRQLAKESGYSIALQGDAAKLAGRKVTLDTGETTFWQAFDQLCQKAGLVEATNPYGAPAFNGPAAMPGGPIQLRQLPAPPMPAAPGKLAPQPVPKVDKQVREAQARAEAVLAQVQAMEEARLVQALLAAVAQDPAPPAKQPPAPKDDKQAQDRNDRLDKARAQALAEVMALKARLAAQAQAQGIQAPAGLGGRQPVYSPYQPGQIYVTDGKPREVPTVYAGALRFRLLPYDRNAMSWIRDKGKGETLLVLEVTAEPKLANFRVEGSPRVDKAVDDQGQALEVVMEPMPNAAGPVAGIELIQRQQRIVNPYTGGVGTGGALVPVRLKLGEKPAKVLKELAGNVTAECLAPPAALLTIDNVMKAAGKSAKGKDGGEMQLVEISKQDDGQVRLRVRMDMVPGGNALVGGVQVQQIQIGGAAGFVRRPGMVGGVAGADGMLSLVDAKGKPYQLVQMPSRSMRGNGNVFTQEMTLVFRPQEGQGEPDRLVVYGRRNAHVQAAFSFKDVNLP